MSGLGDDISILPVESDESHVSLGKDLYKNLRQGTARRLRLLIIQLYKWYQVPYASVQVMKKLGGLFHSYHSNKAHIRLEIGSSLWQSNLIALYE